MTFAGAFIIFFGGYWLFRKTVALLRRILSLILDILIALVELVRWSTRSLFTLCRYFYRDRPRISA